MEGGVHTCLQRLLAPACAQVQTVSIPGVSVGECTGVRVPWMASKVDVIEQANTTWEQRHYSRTRPPLNTRGTQSPGRSVLPSAAALQLPERLYEWTSEVGGLFHPSSSAEVWRHLRPSWVLISTNYIGVVINLGT